jgi:hypothetical protein
VRAIVGVYFNICTLSFASIELRVSGALNITLENDYQVSKAYYQAPDTLTAREGIFYDLQSSEFKLEFDENKALSTGVSKAETIKDSKNSDSSNESPGGLVKQNLVGVVRLASSNSPSGKPNLNFLNQPSKVPLSASSFLSEPTFSLGGFSGANDLVAGRYASITRQGIDSIQNTNQGVSSPDSNKGGESPKVPLANSFSSVNIQPSSNSTGNEVTEASPDLPGFSDAFSGYGPISGLDGVNSGGNITGGNAQASVASLKPHQDNKNNSGDSIKDIPSKDPKPKPVNCQAAKESFYSNFSNTSSYTEEKTVTDKDGKIRKQYCIKPQKNDLYDVYGALGNLEESCPQEIGALFYGSDAESACVWVDDPPSASGYKGNNLGDLFSKESVEGASGKAEVGPTIHDQRNMTSGVGK